MYLPLYGNAFGRGQALQNEVLMAGNYYRILSLDGGGMRGIFTLKLLERLEKIKPGFLSQVDLFAGTSTGGIIALALADGHQPADILAVYRRLGPEIFRRWPASIPPGLHPSALVLKALWDAKYENNLPLKGTLEKEYFSNRTLGSLKKNVLVTSFLLDSHAVEPESQVRGGHYRHRTWKPKFFHNYDVPGSDKTEKIVDVAMRTSAAPVYLPSYGPYIDGAIVASSPSMVALMQAMFDSEVRPKPTSLMSELLARKPLEGSQVALLSLSTGHFDQYIEGKNLNWGILQWGPDLINILMDSGNAMTDWQCRKLLAGNYHRLDPDLREPIPMDVNSPEEFDILEHKAMDANLVDAVNQEVRTPDWLHEFF